MDDNRWGILMNRKLKINKGCLPQVHSTKTRQAVVSTFSCVFSQQYIDVSFNSNVLFIQLKDTTQNKHVL